MPQTAAETSAARPAGGGNAWTCEGGARAVFSLSARWPQGVAGARQVAGEHGESTHAREQKRGVASHEARRQRRHLTHASKLSSVAALSLVSKLVPEDSATKFEGLLLVVALFVGPDDT